MTNVFAAASIFPEGPTMSHENGHSPIVLRCSQGELCLWGTEHHLVTPPDGSLVNTWVEVKAQTSPEKPLVIGRKSGGQIEYLDPAYVPTNLVPNSGRSVLTGNKERDRRVSRAHFSLWGRVGGIVLMNGVPRRGGGIRPPINETLLLAPVERWMEPGEEYLIESGASALIRLPNKTVLEIRA